jgi:hypothetical protein
LTAARWRWQTLAAKIIVITTFTVMVAAVITLLSPSLTRLGMHFAGIPVLPQNPNFGELMANCIFYCWGCAMFGAIIAIIVRAQPGAIVVYLLMPLLIEGLLTLLLKENVKYLPFTALSRVVGTMEAGALHGALPYTQDLLIVLGYIVGGWIVAFALFHKRDAS